MYMQLGEKGFDREVLVILGYWFGKLGGLEGYGLFFKVFLR